MLNNKYFKDFEHHAVDTGEVTIHTWVGGQGEEAILLLHGHPECHLMWHKTAADLARDYTVVVTDMRGYGESSKPRGEADHSTYSKRAMAADQVYVMKQLGFERFHLAGHDRGGRVCHRMVCDYPDLIKSAAMIDIIPTIDVYNRTDQMIATKYWHWFFYIQPEPFPENFLGARPEYFIRSNILKKTIPGTQTADIFPEDIVQEYIRYYSDPATVHAIAEDYRASVGIDREHDLADRDKQIQVPILCIWGSDGNICKIWDVEAIWRNLAADVTGFGVPGCGHFVPEEKPELTAAKIREHIERNK